MQIHIIMIINEIHFNESLHDYRKVLVWSMKKDENGVTDERIVHRNIETNKLQALFMTVINGLPFLCIKCCSK